MKVEIRPNVGINDIKFGMTRKQVAAQIGEASRTEIDNIMDETREIRQGMIFKYVPTKLKDIWISQNATAWIHDIEIFSTANVIELLSTYGKPTPETDGYINFYDLGLSLGGFGKKRIPEGRIVIVFAPDRRQFYEDFLVA